MNRIAQIISAALNPLVVVIIMSFILIYEDTKDIVISLQWGFITLIFILTLSVLIWILVKRKIFSNFDVSLQYQRPRLFLLEFTAALIYLATIYFLHSPVILLVQVLNIMLILIVLFIVNRFIKASGHIAIFSSLVTMLAFVSGAFYLPAFVLVGALGWSRIKLKRHSFKEVLVGGIIGVLVTVFLFSA